MTKSNPQFGRWSQKHLACTSNKMTGYTMLSLLRQKQQLVKHIIVWHLLSYKILCYLGSQCSPILFLFLIMYLFN